MLLTLAPSGNLHLKSCNVSVAGRLGKRVYPLTKSVDAHRFWLVWKSHIRCCR